MIPVLLMLVCPGPVYAGSVYTGSVQAPPQRASDADRDIAADILCAAVGDGRLTLDELDDRLGAALSAHTTDRTGGADRRPARATVRAALGPTVGPGRPGRLPGAGPLVGHPGADRRADLCG